MNQYIIPRIRENKKMFFYLLCCACLFIRAKRGCKKGESEDSPLINSFD